MNFYIGLYIITWIISFFEFFNLKRKNKIILLIFIGCIYIFLGGFRWNGNDWYVYYDFFTRNYTLDDFWNAPIDKGFGLINYLVKSIFDEYTLLLILLAIVIIVVKLWFIKKYAIFPLISLLYWYATYFGDIYFIRQDLAASIALISIYFIIKRNLKVFILLIGIASTIQISSIFFLPAYWIFNKQIKIKYICWGLIISIILGRLIDVSILGSLQNYIFIDQERIASKVDLYVYDYDMNDIEALPLFLGYCRRLLFIPIELWMINRMEKIDKNYRGFVNLIIFGNMLYFLLANMGSTFAVRANYFYVMCEMITIPAIFIFIKKMWVKLIVFFIFSIYLYLKYIFFILNKPEAFIPYINVLFNM